MKKVIVLLFIGLLGITSAKLLAAPRLGDKKIAYQVVRHDDDTVIINVGKSRLVLILSNKEDRKKFKELDLNALLQRVDGYMEAADQAKRDTTIKGKDEEYEISFVDGETRIQVRDKDSKTSRSRQDERAKDREKEESKRRHRRIVVDIFNLDLGFNNYVMPGAGIPNGTHYDLNPLGSRYLAYSADLEVPLSRGARFKVGAELAWMNFMFDGNRRVRNTDQGAEFFRTPEELVKSKMTAAYAGVPVMFEFGRRGSLLGFGVGGYVGYRVGSYTKVVENLAGQRTLDRNHDNLSLNNLRYSLRAEARVYRVTVFFNYDLNPLFAQGRGPELNAFAFGVRI